MIDHLPPAAEPVQALIAEHYGIVCRFYTLSKQAYIGMSLFYGDDLDMMNFHNAYHGNMVPFLAEAISIVSDP